ncbi:MAG: hypothetical protein AAGI25_04215, partial [Bacteroidota bacterium]
MRTKNLKAPFSHRFTMLSLTFFLINPCYSTIYLDTTYLEAIVKPDIRVSQDTLDFGDQFVGAEARETIVVSNSGTDQLVVRDIQLGDTDFTLSA